MTLPVNKIDQINAVSKMGVYNSYINEMLPANYTETLDILTFKPFDIFTNYIDNCSILENKNASCSKNWLILPDPCSYLICHCYEVSKRCRSSEIFCVGPRTKSLEISRAYRKTTILIKFKPFGLASFISCSPEELLNKSVRAELIWGDKSNFLYSDLSASNSHYDYLKAIQNFLILTWNRGRSIDQRLIELFNVIDRSPGDIKIMNFISDIGISQRHLQSITLQHTGLTTKKIIRIHRLLQAIRSLATRKPFDEQLFSFINRAVLSIFISVFEEGNKVGNLLLSLVTKLIRLKECIINNNSRLKLYFKLFYKKTNYVA